MLKTAYQLGVFLATKEASLSEGDLEKLAKFLWYQDVAQAFPTFRKLLGLSPEMGHRVLQAGKKAKKVVKPSGTGTKKFVSRPSMPGMATFDPKKLRQK